MLWDKNKSRLLILNDCIASCYWTYNNIPEVGDLVALQSTREPTKWFISWVIDIKKTGRFGVKYLLESIDDGDMAWWNNVGFYIFDRDELKKRKCWRWSNKQHNFNNKWLYIDTEYFSLKPCQVSFDDIGYGCTLTLRMHAIMRDNNCYNKHYSDYRKVTKKEMQSYHDKCLREFEREKYPEGL